MSRNTRWLWALDLALLGALGLFLFHALLIKQFRGNPLALSVVAAIVFAIVLVNREIAGGINPPARTRLQRAWASIEGPELLLAVLFLALLVAFDSGYLRATADGRSYFVHVRSLVVDWDLVLANESEAFRTPMPEIFPFGSAVLWTPFYQAAHIWLRLLNLVGGSYDVGGFGNPYQMAVGIGSLVYGVAGLWLAFRIARAYFTPWVAALATTFVTLGSFLVWYLTVEPSYSHANSLFTTTLFLWIWQRTRQDRTMAQWAWLGLAGGLMTMVRFQNAVFLLVPLADGLGLTFAALGAPAERLTGVVRRAAAFGAAFLLGFFPQLAFWKAVNGGWFALPHAQAGQQWWSDPLFVDMLFSSNHGLLSWHPILFLAVLGIPLFLRRDFRFGALLTLVFLAQIYINSAHAAWWGGHAFGARRFASCTLLFVLGLAALINWTRRRPLVATSAVLAVFVLANTILIGNIRQGRLPTSQGISLDQMLGGVYDRLGNPFALPAALMLAREYGITPRQYDQLGLQMFNNLTIDVGTPLDERYLGRGWGGPETDREASFRWALGPEAIVVAPLKSATFVLPGEPLEQADYLVRFRAQPYQPPGAPAQSIELWVNEQLAGRVRMSPGPRDYSVRVARELLARNLNAFVFRFATARQVSDDERGDTRRVAARFYRIAFLRQPE